MWFLVVVLISAQGQIVHGFVVSSHQTLEGCLRQIEPPQKMANNYIGMAGCIRMDFTA